MAVLALCGAVRAAEPPLRLERTIPLPGVKGRIDHLTLDAKGERLWLAALGNDTIEVIDLGGGSRIKSIAGAKEPQGVCLIAATDTVVVASGEDGMLRAFDREFKPVAAISGLDDADNVRFDAATQRVYVAYGRGAIAVIDAQKWAKLADIPLDEHPESFQLEKQGRRIFANVPGAKHIAVIDRDRGSVIATWPVHEASANYPMALDEDRRRLFVGCRKPARLLVLDTESGKVVANLECCGDADDVFYDAARKRIYISGGDGNISVFDQADADHYSPLGAVHTAAGARTSLFVPEANRLYVAVPHGLGQEAQVREYHVGP